MFMSYTNSHNSNYRTLISTKIIMHIIMIIIYAGQAI